ncbi:MAG: HEAT repeat domain-containing protein [Planctomycetota bacterium]
MTATYMFQLVFLCLLAGTVHAHGGQYRGPGLPSPGGRGSSTPTSAGAGPKTDPRTAPDQTRWDIWWELNKDPYVRVARGIDGSATGVRNDQRRKEILPALKTALDRSSNRDVTSACLIAIGKVGVDHDKFKILPILRKGLRRGTQELREAAALAMGITKRPDALPDLIALFENSARGRRLMNKGKVDDRTRAFAGYGIGLVAFHSDDADLKAQALASFAKVLQDRRQRSRDVLVAAVNGIRQLNIDVDKSAKHKRVYWQALRVLEDYEAQPLSKHRELIQAHVAPGLARLLAAGNSADHSRFKGLFLDQLHSAKRRHATIYESAALALGRTCLPAAKDPNERLYSEALELAFKKHRDKQTQYFALVAMGLIGGGENLQRLLPVFEKERGPAKAWAALALGLLAFHSDQKGPQGENQIRKAVGAVLHKQLQRSRNRSTNGAIAVALGLCRYQAALPDLRELADKYDKSDEMLSGYACIGIALMDDQGSVPLISRIMLGSELRPVLMTQAAIALARLQHRGSTDALQRMLAQSNQNIIPLAGIANALGFIGDERSVDPLIRLLGNTSKPSLLRAFAAVALGMIADGNVMPWNARIANGINYRANVETLSNGKSGVLDIL